MHHSSSNSSITDEKNRGVAVEKLENMKKWGINTYKVAFFLNSWITKMIGGRAVLSGASPFVSVLLQCTKQMISERFGRGSRTVDLELEAQIEVLRDTRRKYDNVLRLARALTNHFYNMVQTQHALGDTFADLSQKSPELRVRPPGGY